MDEIEQPAASADIDDTVGAPVDDDATRDAAEEAAAPPPSRRRRRGRAVSSALAGWRWNWETIGWVGVLAATVFTRLYLLGKRGMSHDESLHTFYSWQLAVGKGYRHDPMMHGPILYHWTALMYLLFGVSDFTARLFGAISGTLLVLSPLLVRKWLGRFGALVCGAMLLLSPSVMMYSRYIRHDIPVELATVLMLIGFVRYLDSRRGEWIVVAFIGGLIGITSAEMSYITGFMLVSFIAIALWVEWSGQRADDWRPWATRLGVAALIGAAAFGVRTMAGLPQIGDSLTPSTLPAWQLAAIGAALVLGLAALAPLLARAMHLEAASDWRTPLRVGVGLALVGVALRLAVDPGAGSGTFAWYLGKIAVSLMAAGTPLVAIGAVGSIVPLPAVGTRLGPLVAGGTAAVFYVVVAEGLISRPITSAFDTAYYGWQIAAVAAVAAVGIWVVTRIPRDHVWAVLTVLGLAMLSFDLSVQYGAAVDRFIVWQRWSGIVGGVLFALGASGIAADASLRRRGDASPAGRLLLRLWPPAFGVGLGCVAFALLTRGSEDVQHLTAAAEPLAVGSGIVLALAIGAAYLAMARPRRGILVQLNELPYDMVLAGALIFVVLYVALFTTWFQENDLANGFARSLKYWWSQHTVQRGGQPWYFYIAVIGPLYEWLPMILSACAIAVYAVRPALLFGRGDDEGDAAQPSAAAWVFTPMIIVWMLGVWWIFSWAGEKMPWLITHMAVPMIFLSARFVADVFDGAGGLDLAAWRATGWRITAAVLAALALLAGLVARSTTLAAAAAPRPAAVGWGVAIVVVVLAVAAVRSLGGALAPRQRRKAATAALLLFGLSVSAGYALVANFRNSELATEYLVYAHGTPDDKMIYNLLKRMDAARPDQPLKLGFDNEVSWPYTWYFRNICPPRARGLAADLLCLAGEGCPAADACSDWRQDPKYLAEGKSVDVAGLKELDAVLVGSPNYGNFEPYLRKDFVSVEVNRMYWPNEGYKGLTWQRIKDTLFVPELRANLLRILFHREYVVDPMAKPLVPKSLDDWFYHAKMKLWVKKTSAKEFAATGEDWPAWMKDVPIEEAPDTSVKFTIDKAITEADGLTFNAPKDIALAPDGSLYVVDHGNKRIVHLAADGTTIKSIEEPTLEYGDKDAGPQPSAWGIGVGPDGAVYVADTWNNRILVYRGDRWTEQSFGTGGVPADGAADKDLDKLFGPRDVAVGPDGNIYFTDTGNKRIIMLDKALAPLRSIGHEGPGDGEFNEPVSVAFDAETGEMVVADLWNLRVQVFDKNLQFARAWTVDGWGSKEAAHKAYVAIGPGHTILVTDPQGARVWIYDATGKVLGTLDLENDPTGLLQPIGIAVSPEGQIYVASSEKNVVSRYEWPDSLRAAAGLEPTGAATGAPADGTAAPSTPPTAAPTATPAAADAGGASRSPLASPTLGQAAKP